MMLVTNTRNARMLCFTKHRRDMLQERLMISMSFCSKFKKEYYQNCFVLGCVTQCSQSAAHSYEQFLQVQQIVFVTLGPLRHV